MSIDKDRTLSSSFKSPKTYSMNLKKQLKTYFDHFDLSAAQVARKAGVPKQSLSGWMAGNTPRDLNQLRKVAEVLGTTVDDLLFGSGVHHEDKRPNPILENLIGEEWIGGVFEIRIRRIRK